MLSAEDGVPIKTVKSFLSKFVYIGGMTLNWVPINFRIPSVFTGQDLVNWLLQVLLDIPPFYCWPIQLECRHCRLG